MTNFEEIANRLSKIEERVTFLENNNKKSASSTTSQIISSVQENQKPELQAKLESTFNYQPKNQDETGRNLLGYIGSACIVLAAILLIKLSVDSGWLTPSRQCAIAILIACTLIVLPFFMKLKDKAYSSFLPAIGITILHLTTYGSVFYYNLLDPSWGIVAISFIGIFSLWLLVQLEEDSYSLLAIFGTYLGIIFFHESFSNISTVAFYLLVWDVIFCLFAIKAKRRSMIAISSYLAFILVAIIGISDKYSMDLNQKILLTQTLQFVIFASAIVIFSIKNKMKLTAKEAWSFFPVIILFYGQQYFFLYQISENAATLLALAFAFILLLIYHITQSKIKDVELDSAGMIYTVFSIIIAHSIFIVELNDFFRVTFAILVIALLWLFQDRVNNDRNLEGSLMVGLLVIIYSYILVLTNLNNINLESLLCFGVVFGAIALYGSTTQSDNTKSIIILYLGHLQIIVALFRLQDILGSFAITPLWMVYAFAILYWAYSKKDKDLAQSAVILIITGLISFFLSDFIHLSSLQRTLSLFLTGGLIFTGGYFYRNVAKE